MPHELRVCAEKEKSDYAFFRIFLPAGNDSVTFRMRLLRGGRSFRNARRPDRSRNIERCCAWLRSTPERNRLNALAYSSTGILPMPAWEASRPAVLRWGFAPKLFEYAIKLREGLESRSECDFANAQFGVSQEVTCGEEASARDVLDKIDTNHLLEILA